MLRSLSRTPSGELSPSLSARSKITAEGHSYSTNTKASATDATLVTRAPAAVKASAMLNAISGSSSQMRIEQPAKLELLTWWCPMARLSAKLPGGTGGPLNGPHDVPSRRSILQNAQQA